MAETTPTGLHTPVSNQSVGETAPSAEQTQDPDAGSEAGVAEPAGEVEIAAPALEAMAAEPALEAPDTSNLVDIGAASFADPGAVLETVHGVDNRVKIDDTAKYPYRAIASLLITARDGSQWIGTGWFISPRTLVTAGHCVFIKGSGDPNRDGWVSSIDVMPGRNGLLKPLGTLTSKTFWSVRGWTERGDQNQDYGAIILDQPFGFTTGWFGYAVYQDNRLVGVGATVAGYPGDKPSGTIWQHSLPISSVSEPKVFYAIDTAGGQSGAAVFLTENNLPVAVAVHAYGGSVSNSGTRITPAVYQNFRQWTL